MEQEWLVGYVAGADREHLVDGASVARLGARIAADGVGEVRDTSTPRRRAARAQLVQPWHHGPRLRDRERVADVGRGGMGLYRGASPSVQLLPGGPAGDHRSRTDRRIGRTRRRNGAAFICGPAAVGITGRGLKIRGAGYWPAPLDFQLQRESTARGDLLAQRQRHARRRAVRNTVLVVANLPRNLVAEQIVVALPAFHEELTVALVEYERSDRGFVVRARVVGKRQLVTPCVDDRHGLGAA